MRAHLPLLFAGLTCLGSGCVSFDQWDIPPGTPSPGSPTPSGGESTPTATPPETTGSPGATPTSAAPTLTPTQTQSPTDLDGDGYAGSMDCDESDPAVHGGAEEVCEAEEVDPVDNDCDGKVDEGVGDAWYEDGDGDGYGNDRGVFQSCSPPEGSYATQGGDCDNADPKVYPGAQELCDGKDNDCNGRVDDGPDESGDGTADCLDDDGDGVSEAEGDCDDANPSVSPDLPECYTGIDDDCDGEVDEGAGLDGDGDGATLCEDCDDTDPAKRPDAGFEWADGRDNDCDGTVDEVSVVGTGAAWIYEGPSNEESAWCGSDMGGGVDFNGDGFGDLVITCPLYGTDNAGRATVYFGTGGRLSRGEVLPSLVLDGDIAGASAGVAVAIGDYGGDGLPDLVVAQPVYNRVSILSGPLQPSEQPTTPTALGKNGAYTGASISAVGWSLALAQLDDAPGEELVIGVPYVDSLKGRVFILPGGKSLADEFNIQSEASELTPVMDRAEGTLVTAGGYGSALATLGDFDGDGRDDVALGAWKAHGTASGGGRVTRGGAVEILYGGSSLTSILNGSGGNRGVIGGAQEDGAFGFDVSAPGDINGDGIDDLIVGAPYEGGAAARSGRAYVILGGEKLTGSRLVSELGDRIHATVTCPEADCRIGMLYSTGGLGDVNGDGAPDYAVGGAGFSQGSRAARGATGIFLGGPGSLTGEVSLEGADALFIGTAEGDNLGIVGRPGDLDEDGYFDVLFGAILAKVPGGDNGEDAGEGYLFFGY